MSDPRSLARAPGFDLLIISDGAPALCARIERALAHAEPGRVAILLREPGRASAELLELGRTLRALTHERGARLLVHDRIDLAMALGADGVHLPEAGMPPETVRSLLDSCAPELLIGASRHGAEGLASAAAAGADYATLSPVYLVAGKAPPLGADGFAALCARAGLPVFALGGVRAAHVPALQAAGARGVAVMREVLSAEDPGAATSRLLAALRVR